MSFAERFGKGLRIAFVAQLAVIGAAGAQTTDLPDNLWDLLVTGPYSSVEYEYEDLDDHGDREAIQGRVVFGRGFRQIQNAGWVVYVTACRRSGCTRGKWHEQQGTEFEVVDPRNRLSASIPLIGRESLLRSCRNEGRGFRDGEVRVIYRCEEGDDGSSVFYVNPDERTITSRTTSVSDRFSSWTIHTEYDRWVEIGHLRVASEVSEHGESDDGLSYSVTRSLRSLQPNIPYDSSDYTEAWVRSQIRRFGSR